MLKTAPTALVNRIEKLERILATIDERTAANDGTMPRESIRAYRDARVEVERARVERARYESGSVAQSYYDAASRHISAVRQCRADDSALGRVEDSLVSISVEQQHKRYRARSDLDRTIRMALRQTNDDTCMQRHAIVDEFLSDFHGHEAPIYLMHGDICIECNAQMLVRTDGASLECPQCGTSAYTQDSTANSVAFNDDVEYSNFTYKVRLSPRLVRALRPCVRQRANHFQEWLNVTMAKQSCPIPNDVLTAVMETLHRERVKPEVVTARRVREALKTCRLRRWYEHSMLIACKMTGRPPPRMEPEVEERLRRRFQEMQEPFEVCARCVVVSWIVCRHC